MTSSPRVSWRCMLMDPADTDLVSSHMVAARGQKLRVVLNGFPKSVVRKPIRGLVLKTGQSET